MFTSRPIAITLTAVVLALVPADIVAAQPCWPPPVQAPVADPFRAPACSWCPGNRGIEYGTPAGWRVTAVATGRVAFAGAVAGTVFVVVRHGDGRRVTYGNLRPTTLVSGDLIVRGAAIGRTAGRLHLGLRVGDRYVDPAPHLGRLVRRPWLVPVDGTPSNPPPPPTLRCNGRRDVR